MKYMEIDKLPTGTQEAEAPKEPSAQADEKFCRCLPAYPSYGVLFLLSIALLVWSIIVSAPMGILSSVLLLVLSILSALQRFFKFELSDRTAYLLRLATLVFAVIVLFFFIVRIASATPAFPVDSFPDRCHQLEGCARVGIANSNRNDQYTPAMGKSS